MRATDDQLPTYYNPFSFEASSATCAFDGMIVVAVHAPEAVLLLRGSRDAARSLALGILHELAGGQKTGEPTWRRK
jgi:hypothetical protein